MSEIMLPLHGKDFSRFILKDTKNRTFPRHKSKKDLEDILLSYYETRIENIYKRKSKKSKELLKNIHHLENENIKKNINTLTYQSYQQKLFYEHYDYLIKDKLQGYYIKKVDNQIIINNFSKNIKIIDLENQIISNSNSNNLQEEVRIMIEIALAKNWKLENIEPTGNENFINEVNRQIAALILKNKKEQIKNTDIEILRAKSPTQQEKVKLQNEELNSKINLQELKENLDAKLVLEYAKKNFKLDISNFIITEDNKIDNLKNKQKPKNVIDFLQKELNLSTKEAIEVCTEIYENSVVYSDEIEKKSEYRKKRNEKLK